MSWNGSFNMEILELTLFVCEIFIVVKLSPDQYLSLTLKSLPLTTQQGSSHVSLIFLVLI